MSENNIEMKDIDTTHITAEKTGVLAEEGEITIWQDDSPSDKYIFVNIGNGTLSMPEAVFYSLTKSTQIAAKKLLELED